MAFSTQKDFFHVPFMNETVEYECKKACVKLKSYDSTIDDRSWAMDEAKQSKFLSDLVTCQTPVSEGRGGRGPDGDNILAKHGISGGDSLLECATANFGRLDDMLNEKKSLQKQLDVSNERLKTANEENQKIKNIMNTKYDSSHSKDFYNKIQKLSSSGKINKSDENELLHIYHKTEDMNKAYEVLQAENSYLKRLVEKLSRRASLDAIKVEAEKCCDIPQLQNMVNTLRKELAMLRKLEDDKLIGQQAATGNRRSDQDAENLRAILKERNTLREKCRTFKDLEKKVLELQKKAQVADHMSDNLSNNLDNQSKYINDMEQEMKNMQCYYEDQIQKSKFNEELQKCQLEQMKEELIRARCEAQKADCLQMEIGCLRNEIMRRDAALNDYDCQYKQLMCVIDELQGNPLQNDADVNDAEAQTCDDLIEDLAFFTSATISEIMKELKNRGCTGGADGRIEEYGLEEDPRGRTDKDEKFDAMKPEPPPDRKPENDCCSDLERLQKLIEQLKVEKAKLEDNIDCSEFCADALKKLKDLQAEFDKLKKEASDCKADNDRLRKEASDCKAENERLNKTIKEQAEKLTEFTNKINKLEKDLEKNAKEAAQVGKDLNQTVDLVKQISDVKLKNTQLTGAVNALNTLDDQKIIDDLRRQLADCEAKNKQCQQEKEKLEKELKAKDIELNKIKAENDKLQKEKENLQKERDNLQKERDNLQKERDNLQKEKDSLQKERDNLQKERDNLQKERDNLKNERDNLKKERDNLKNERDNLQKEKDKLEKERDNLIKEKEKLEKERDNLQKEKDKLEKERDNLQREKDKLEKERDNLIKEKEKLEKERDNLQKEKDKLEKERDNLQKEKDKLEKERDNLIKEKEKLEKERDNLQKEKDKLEKERDNLQKEKDKLEKERDNLQKEKDSLQKEKDKLEKENKDLTDKAKDAEAAKKEPAPEVAKPPAETAKPPEAGPKEDDGNVADEDDDAVGGGGAGTGADGTKGGKTGGAAGGPGTGGPGSAKGGGGRGPSPVRGAPGGTPGKKVGKGGKGGDTGDADPYQQFVDENATQMKVNMKAGCGLERELRRILDSFIQECGFCFCKSSIPKSKFYCFCHKILHYGIQALTFRELLYMHKKIYLACNRLHPGCLLNMILTENNGQDFETDGLKCCSCKSALCCNNSEEMLKEKVSKLERDIEMAKEYLDNFKINPQSSHRKSFRHGRSDEEFRHEKNVTYRSSKPVSKCSSKQMKTLKARILKCSELLR